MQIIKTLALFILAIAMASCGASEQKVDTKNSETAEKKVTEEAQSYTINTDKSQVNWKGSILSVKSHEGTLKLKPSKFTVQGDKILKGVFTVDMSSMVATDENYQPEEGKTKEQLIGHLSSPDFFDVASHPTAILAVVDGKATLTVRGHAKGIELSNVKMSPNGDNMKASAEFTFNRQDFGVAYDMGAKDMAINDDIQVKVEITASKS